MQFARDGKRSDIRRTAARNAVIVGAAVLLSGLLVVAAGAQMRNPDGVAVIIGNRAYKYDVPQVTYAHRDAAAFRRYVVDVLGFDPENVIHEKDADKATLERVFGNRDRLMGSELWRHLHPYGLSDVVVFYSGHGIPGLNDKRGYLLPVNAHPDSAELNGYPIDVLYDNLVKLKEQKAVRSVHVFLDACFSGDSGGGKLIGSTSAIRVAPLKASEGLEKLTILTAASGKEVASWDKTAKHGLFTHHLLNALYGGGDADANGQVTAAETKAYLDRHMTRAARRLFGRVQNAELRGMETAVLARAVTGIFPVRPLIGPVVKPNPVGQTPDDTKAPDPATERLFWESIKDSEDSVAFAAYLKQYPDGVYADLARQRQEKRLGLKPADLQSIQLGLEAAGFTMGSRNRPFEQWIDEARRLNPGVPDERLQSFWQKKYGAFDRRTRVAIERWQASQGRRATGYLDEDSAATLRAAGQRRADDEAYARAATSGTAEAYEAYITAYPAGEHMAQARQLQRALRHFQQEKYDEAITDLNEVIRINPQNAEVYIMRGNAKIELGRFEEALADFNEVIRINPQNAGGYGWRGNAKIALGRYDEAISDYNEFIRINPPNAMAYVIRGSTKFLLGRYQEAIADSNEAIHINPQSAEAYVLRGVAKTGLGRHEEAIADHNDAIRINPQDDDAYARRGDAKIGLGRYDEALADLNEAIRINPQNALAYALRGSAKSKLNRDEEAIADSNEAIRINPRTADAYWVRGNSNRGIGEYEKARADLQRALKLAREQDNQVLAQAARKSLDELPPAGGEGATTQQAVQEEVEETRREAESLKSLLANLDQQMVHVQGGTFMMGCTEEQSDCYKAEKPVHRVRVRSFAISKYEVTQALWEVVMGENPSRFGYCDLCPVEKVSWEDIRAFLKKLNNLTGERYRLPTEAEWEYVARGGQHGRGYQYAGSNEPGSVAWYDKNSGSETHPVGQTAPNELGLYDMSGNVWEWVQDCWHGRYAGAPSDGEAWGSGDCSRRVLRGGSWLYDPRNVRSAVRHSGKPGYRSDSFGFRVARTFTGSAAMPSVPQKAEEARQKPELKSGPKIANADVESSVCEDTSATDPLGRSLKDIADYWGYDPEEAYAFGLKIQDAVRARDLAKFFSLVDGELDYGPRRKYAENKSFHEIFPDSWRAAILKKEPPCTPVGWRGFMLANGLVRYKAPSEYIDTFRIVEVYDWVPEKFPPVPVGWKVDNRLLPPTCFEYQWVSGDNFEAFAEQFSIADYDDFAHNTGKYFGDPIYPFKPIYPFDNNKAVRLWRYVGDCARDLAPDQLQISDSTVEYFYPDTRGAESLRYTILAEVSPNLCQGLAPKLAGKCLKSFLVDIANCGGSMGCRGGWYNIYGMFQMQDGERIIFPLKNFRTENLARNFLDNK